VILVDTGPIVAVINDHGRPSPGVPVRVRAAASPPLVPATVATEMCLLPSAEGVLGLNWRSSPISGPAGTP